MNKEKRQQLYRNELILGALESNSVRDLAQRSGVCNETILRGKRGENISIKTLRALAKGIGVSIHELIVCDADVTLER